MSIAGRSPAAYALNSDPWPLPPTPGPCSYASSHSRPLRRLHPQHSRFPKPGILFRDITPLLAAPAAFRQAIDGWPSRFRPADRPGGGRRGPRIHLRRPVGAGPVRGPGAHPQAGQTPGKTLSHTYELEYGTDTLQVHADAVSPGANVLMVDDLLATGGTIEACCRMVEQAGGRVVGCAFLIELVAWAARADRPV